ncbi:uncharacterized protein LOC131026125 [Salvia miltiorrhiza]|uniref:uncharacterized protein LOC131026125 n=1 Tax=Salvia miltiorrhiza TaxID=226208 RepID=UPI0025ABEA39|nr:uncharacterized protein LOC131026125 [Salvia miltiorrhiza]
MPSLLTQSQQPLPNTGSQYLPLQPPLPQQPRSHRAKEIPAPSAESAFSKMRREAARLQILQSATNRFKTNISSSEETGTELTTIFRPATRPEARLQQITADRSKEGGGGDFSDQDPNSTFHQQPNGWVENGVSSLDIISDEDADEDVEKEVEEATESERAIERAFREDEARRNAPLTAENSGRVMDAIRTPIPTTQPTTTSRFPPSTTTAAKTQTTAMAVDRLAASGPWGAREISAAGNQSPLTVGSAAPAVDRAAVDRPAEAAGPKIGGGRILDRLEENGVNEGSGAPILTEKMFCDNKAAISISENPVQHDRTKHVEVDRHFIKEKIEGGIVTLPFVRFEDQLADILTRL